MFYSCVRGVLFGTVALVGVVVALAAEARETYRLVQAIGNTESVSAKGLSKTECEYRKKELQTVATALGSYDERTGKGSITCLPDSFFN